MSLVSSLLQAIVSTDGEALVMHVGEKPYVVSPTGQGDLATRGLTFDAVNGIVNQLLPIESQRALDEFGAAKHELLPIPEFPGELFTVVAARAGEDLWAEIRRRRVPDEDSVPMELFGPTAPEAAAEAEARGTEPDVTSDGLEIPDSAHLWPEHVGAAAAEVEDDQLTAPETRSLPLPAAKPSPPAIHAPEPTTHIAPPPISARSPIVAPPPVAVSPPPIAASRPVAVSPSPIATPPPVPVSRPVAGSRPVGGSRPVAGSAPVV